MIANENFDRFLIDYPTGYKWNTFHTKMTRLENTNNSDIYPMYLMVSWILISSQLSLHVGVYEMLSVWFYMTVLIEPISWRCYAALPTDPWNAYGQQGSGKTNNIIGQS